MNSPPNNISIRFRNDRDLSACASLLVEVHAIDGYPVEGVAEPRAWLTPTTEIQSWIAEWQSRIVGHVMLMHPAGEASVKMWCKRTQQEQNQTLTKTPVAVGARLFVAPTLRHRGIGKQLILAAIDYAAQNEFVLVLDVLTKDKSAIRLYEQLGCLYLGDTWHIVGEALFPARCYALPPNKGH